MSRLYKYRIYCTTDSKWEYIWSENSPTTCPTNIGHSVNTNSVSTLEDIRAIVIDDTDSPHLMKNEAIICDTTSGNITLSLPKVGRNKFVQLIIHKRVAANTVTIDGHDSEQIDGSATLDLTEAEESVILESNGTQWIQVLLNTNDVVEHEDIIITRTKGDLVVDDGNEKALLELRTNGQLLKVDTTAELGMIWYSRNYLQLINVGGSINFNTNKSWTNIYWDTEVRKDSIFTHSEVDTNGDITINKSGWFEFCIDVSVEQYQSNSRTVSEVKLNRNGSEHPGTKAVFYNRTSGYGHNGASINLLINVTSGDVFRIQGRIISGGGKVRTYSKGCRLMIKEII